MRPSTAISKLWLVFVLSLWAACGNGGPDFPSITDLAIAPTSASIEVGQSVSLTATATVDGQLQTATEVTFTSSDPSVAELTSTSAGVAVVHALKPGTAAITATLGELTATANVTVQAPHILSIAITPTAPSIAAGTSTDLVATATYSDTTTADVTTLATWTSSATQIGTVVAGHLVGVSTGTAEISATLDGVTGTTTATITAATLTSIQVTPTNPSVAKGLTVDLTATGTFSDNTTQDLTGQATWTSANAAIATVATGVVTGTGVGTTTITASFGGMSGATDVSVTAATLTSIALTPASPSVAKGLSVPLTATGTFTDNSTADLTSQATWTSSAPTIASVASTGVVGGVAVGGATITATVGTISGSTDVTVTAATLTSIAITPNNPTVAKGLTRQFTATGTFSDATTQDLTTQVTWSSGDTAIATISNAQGSRGLATGAGVGTATITATLGAVSTSTGITISAATLASIAVTPPSPSIAKGLTQPFTATGAFSDGTTADLTTQVMWTSSAPTIATVSSAAGSEGVATAVGTGNATITATLGAVSGATTLTVTSATLVSIAVTPTNPAVAKGRTRQLTATGTFTDASTRDLTTQVTWSSTATGVATISNAAGSEGLATTSAVGSTTIRATLGAISGTTTLTVTAAALVSIEVTPTNPSIAKGLSRPFAATGTFTDGTTADLTTQVTWASSDLAVATVSNANGSQGAATGAGVGSATISASLAGITGSTTLTVTAATLVSIGVTPTGASLTKGLTLPFTATGTFTDSTTQDLTTQVTWASSNTAAASVSNALGSEGVVTGVGTGTTSISATLGAITGAASLTVTPATLVSIQVTPTNPSVAKGLTVPFTATGTFTDSSTQDLTTQVTWASSNTTVASVSNAQGSRGVATGTAVGTATITASLSGKSGATTLDVTAATLVSIEVTPTNPSVAKGLTLPFTATGTFTDSSTQDLTGAVTWASSSGAATISNAAGSHGVATGTAVGASTISATLGAVTGSTTLTVTAATLVSIEVTPTNPSVAKGLTLPFTATGTFTDSSTQDLTTTVTWGSSSTQVATISNAAGSHGVATGAGTGTATITATSGAITGSTTLTVSPATLVSIAVTPTNPSVTKGLTQPFTATGTFTDNSTQDLTTTVTWGSSDTAVATVSNAAGSHGLATAVGAGATTITATLGAVSGSTSLTVTAASLVSIAVTPTNPSVAKGLTRPFTATGTFTDSSSIDLTAQVTWASSSTAIATISNATGSHGLATAVGVGATTISATMDGVTGTSTLTVSAAALVSIDVTPASPSLVKGLTLPFTATGTFTDNSTADLTTQVTWASSDTQVAAISNAAADRGTATGVGVGATTISATLSGITGSTTLTVSAATLVSIDVTPTNPSIAKGLTQPFTATGTFTDNTTSDLTTQVTWASSDTQVAAISNAAADRGTATGLGVGSSTISASLGAISGSTTLTVTAATLVSIDVTPTNPSISVGVDQQLGATGTFSDATTQDLTTAVTWSSSDEQVAVVGNASEVYGVVSGIGTGAATITATLGTVSGSTTVTVTTATLVSIEVTPTNPTVAAGLTQPFTATGVFSDNHTADLTTQVTWSSSDTETATISNAAGSQGLASAGAPGATSITASFGAVSGSTTLTVTSADLISIEVTPTEQSLAKGLTLRFTATGTFSDSSTADLTTQVTWSSSDTQVATISNALETEGLATGTGVGTTQITATLGAISGSTALAGTAAKVSSIDVTPHDPSIAKGLTQQFTATATFTDQTTADVTTQVTWASSNGDAVVVSNANGSQGLATALGTGAATVSATLGGVTGQTTMTVTQAQLVSIAVTPAFPSVAVNGTQPLTATGTFTDATTQDLTTQVTWASAQPTIATVSNAGGSQGLVTGVATGTTTITASFGALSGGTNVTVTGPTIVSIAITPTTATLMVGQRVQLKATATFSDNSTADVTATAQWGSTNESIAFAGTSGNNPGRVETLAQGTATIVAQVDNVVGSQTVTVGAVTCHVVVNEVRTAGATAADEWVELYNPCNTTFDIATWNVVYRSANGTTDVLLGAFSGTSAAVKAFAPQTFRLVACAGAATAVVQAADVTYNAAGSMSATGGGVAVRSGAVGNGPIVDSMGYGTATNAFVEGTAIGAPASAATASRSPFDGKDTNANNADFVATGTPSPKAANQ